MFKLKISSQARRELKKLKERHQKALVAALEELIEDPFMGKPLTRELTGKFSLRVGVYRIIYTVNRQNKTVQILTAGHRSTVYRKAIN